jgi:hypothetical protein
MSIPAKLLSFQKSPRFQTSDGSLPQSHSLDAFLCMQADLQRFAAALNELNLALSRLSELKATRISRSLILFLASCREFQPLLRRVTRNGWLSLTDDEKKARVVARRQTAHLESEKAQLNHRCLRESVSKKFFKANRLMQPIGLSQSELLWISRNPTYAEILAVRARFLLPNLSARFDFSDAAYAGLAKRLQADMLAPSDIEVLSQYGVPVSAEGAVSLDDSQWLKDPYAKAVLYSLIKFRRADSKYNALSRAPNTLPKFKRVSLDDDIPATQASGRAPSESRNVSSQPQTSNDKLKRVELDDADLPLKSEKISRKPSAPRYSIFNRLKSVVLSIWFL